MVVQLSNALPNPESNPFNSRCGCFSCSAARSPSNDSSNPNRTDAFNINADNVTKLSDPASDEYYVNALIWSETPRWNSSSPLGTPVALTYAFMTAVPSYYTVTRGVIDFPGDDGNTGTGFNPISDTLRQQQIRVALSRWSDVANITFSLVASGGTGQIQFGMTDLSGGAVGMAFPPATKYGTARGDVWLDSAPSSENGSFALGTFGFQTVFHELGHTLGLKHPFDNQGATLSGAENSFQYTNMAYDYHAQMGGKTNRIEPTTALLYDIAAIQYLYGANTSTRTGDDSYTWANNSAFIEAIWDGGGTDTIDASNQTRRVILNLGAGTFSSIGSNGNEGNAVSNLAIAYGVTIENATGGSGDDTIYGNGARNILRGGTGADTMRGQDGNDTYVVDNVGDRVIEYDSTGTDTGGEDGVESAIDFDLQNARNVEVLTLTGSAIRGIGNELNNTIFGNESDNWIEGGEGNDTLYGSIYTSLLFNNDIDILLGGNGDDYLFGGAGIDYLRGDAGTDTLDGSDGNDDLQGGTGNDTLKGGEGNDYLTGGDTLTYTNTGDDFLDGGLGADVMAGQDGNDTYIVDSSLDQVKELDKNNNDAGGIDSVQSSVNYILPIYVENLTLTGFAFSGDGNTSNNTLIGNDRNNILRGFAGNDLLGGGIGNDTLIGGIGDDSYIVDSLQDLVIEAAEEGSDRVFASVNWTLGATLENLTLFDGATIGIGNNLNNDLVGNSIKADILRGGIGNDTLNGRGGNDYLNGGEGNDVLDGGTGNDTLEGTTGDDIYFVDSLGDVIIDSPGTGIETVRSSVSWGLGAGLDHLTLTGTAAINATGNALNNIITGNSAANILDGSIGDDTLAGETGDDTYIADSINDIVRELLNEGTDTVRTSLTWTLDNNLENLILLGTAAVNGTGNSLNNVITGNSAANILNGGTGNDTLIGGTGDDFYIIDSLGDVIIESSGTGIETVQSSVSWTLGTGLDHLVLTGTAAINGTGNTINNRIIGNSAGNILDGGIGNDILEGGSGDDIYIVDSVNDVIIDSSGTGTETVQSSISWTLGVSLNNLILTGTFAISGTGNTLNNIIFGNSANNQLTGGIGDDTLNGGAGSDYLNGGDGSDRLNGGDGSDTLEGGYGDDIYIVDSAGDIIIESSGTGIETVQSSVSWILGAGLDYLTLTGTAAIRGTGNALTNTIAGNSSNNILNGRLGNDTLTGGGGADSFVFDTGTSFTSEIGVDRVTDFLVGTDKIVLDKSTFTALFSTGGGALEASEFAIINDAINGATLSGASIARIVFNQSNGDLFYNPNGSLSGLGAGGLFATLIDAPSLTVDSFAIQA